MGRNAQLAHTGTEYLVSVRLLNVLPEHTGMELLVLAKLLNALQDNTGMAQLASLIATPALTAHLAPLGMVPHVSPILLIVLLVHTGTDQLVAP
jgi:hypothetical protein